MIKSVNPHAGLGKFSFTPPVKQSVNPHAGFGSWALQPSGGKGLTVRNDIGQGPTPTPSVDWYTENLPGTNLSPYSNTAKSQWELDDDTRDFLTDAFNTLNQEDEALDGGYGGGSGGGGSGGGLGGQFSGGPGTQHGTTWSFGNRPAFTPKGIF